MGDNQDAVHERTLGARIAAAYVQAGFTTEAFARAVEVSVETVHAWQDFEDVPSLIALGDIANRLHISKRALCFGPREFTEGKHGEPNLSREAISALLIELDTSADARSAFENHRRCVAPDHVYTRTFVATFVQAWQTMRRAGSDSRTAQERAMVIATQTNALAKAVAQGARPIRPHQITKPPAGLGHKAGIDHIAAEIHRLSGLKPPIDPEVLAVANGLRLVPTYGDTGSGSDPSTST